MSECLKFPSDPLMTNRNLAIADFSTNLPDRFDFFQKFRNLSSKFRCNPRFYVAEGFFASNGKDI